MALVPWKSPSLSLRLLTAAPGFPAGRRNHHLDKLFCDPGLQSLGVALIKAHDVDDQASVPGFRVEIYLSRARPRRQTPGRGRFSFADGVIDLAGLVIDHIGQPHSWAGPIFVGPWRRRGQRDHLMLARREDEGDVTVRRRGAAWAGCVAPLGRHRGHRRTHDGNEEGRRKLDRSYPPARET